jgi:sugar phosphate isomerase/epimerase
MLKLGEKAMAGPRIGVSMLYCLTEPFSKMVAQIPQTGTKYVEVVDDGLHTLDKRRVSKLKELGESYGLEFTVHAPFAGINIATPSRLLLNATLKRLKQSIVNASTLECRLWIFHPAMKTGISMFYPGKDWVRNLESVRSLLRYARQHNVEPAIENVMEPFIMKTAEDFKRFCRELDDEIGMVLDTGHAHLYGELENFLTGLSDKIVHMHVHDNDGKSDRHLGVGCGSVDWNRFGALVKETKFEGVVVVESVDHVEESQDRLRRLLCD